MPPTSFGRAAPQEGRELTIGEELHIDDLGVRVHAAFAIPDDGYDATLVCSPE
jgi:hypothetical protein